MTDFYFICSKCGGICCKDAKPPITKRRLEILLNAGAKLENFEYKKYRYPKVREDGFCIFFIDGKCSVHNVKPETCVAGPFTFDLKNEKLEIYIKKPTICPLVSLLKEDQKLYEEQLCRALENIVRLILDLDRSELEEILKVEEYEIEKVFELNLCEYLRDRQKKL
ncbi:MAG: YkgJ family cysteine cluster protein [Archaeoglobaceae archaeon]|nr:YkgJ family cysteine cluster protein [Archaeoglobaceae archaeon]MCX8151478.1 YkgJ family cysteine cluster protein [Archaeoglobaceae archaeon]MDW8014240.1 YkgJ family cysteine cluster protein [Archaeoglobaceae archaeon]